MLHNQTRSFVIQSSQVLWFHLAKRDSFTDRETPPHELFAGSQDGRIHVWNAEVGSKIAVLEGKRPPPLKCVKFNPRYIMLASTCSNMAFWLPTVEEWWRCGSTAAAVGRWTSASLVYERRCAEFYSASGAWECTGRLSSALFSG